MFSEGMKCCSDGTGTDATRSRFSIICLYLNPNMGCFSLTLILFPISP